MLIRRWFFRIVEEIGFVSTTLLIDGLKLGNILVEGFDYEELIVNT